MGSRNPTSTDLVADPLHTAIRAQANFLECVPIALTLTTIAELNGANKRTLTWAMGLLFVFRVAHVELGLLVEGRRGLGRHVGYWGSLGWMAGLSWWAVWLSREYWGN